MRSAANECGLCGWATKGNLGYADDSRRPDEDGPRTSGDAVWPLPGDPGGYGEASAGIHFWVTVQKDKTTTNRIMHMNVNHEIFRMWAALDDNGIPGNPWGTDANELHKSGKSIQHAIDMVILFWLQGGDSRPLAALFELGCAPGIGVLRFLSEMLEPRNSISYKPDYKFSLSRLDGKRGPRKSPEIRTRDYLLAKNVRKLMTHRGCYDAAIKQVTDFANKLPEMSISEQSVRNAYDSQYGKKKGN